MFNVDVDARKLEDMAEKNADPSPSSNPASSPRLPEIIESVQLLRKN